MGAPQACDRETADPGDVGRTVIGRVLAPNAKLPMLPTVASDVLSLANDREVSFQRVDKVVRQDPLVAARVVAVANSPMFVASGTVTSLRTAMLRLGWGTLRDVLYQAVAEAHIFRRGPRRALRIERMHAVAVAHLTRYLCRELHLDSEYAFLCGLLHDLGRPFALQVLDGPDLEISPDDFGTVVDRIHCDLGARIAQAWNLPPLVSECAGGHHDPDETADRMAMVVGAADEMAHHHGLGSREVDLVADPPPVFATLGLDGPAVEALLERTTDLRAEIH